MEKAEVQKIKVDVLKIIYGFIVLTSAIALSIYFYELIILKTGFSSIYTVISFITTLITFFVANIVRELINVKNYKNFLWLLIILFSFSIILAGISGGPNSNVLNLLIITAILTITIVVSARAGFTYFIVCLTFVITLVILDHFSIIQYSHPHTDNEWLDMAILLAFIWLNFNIAKIAYTQIQNYLTKTLDYSSKLQSFNIELNKMVKDRTNILQKNFNKRIESMYNTAMVGNIAKPLIHDILSPFSALEGTLQLIQEEGEYNIDLLNQAIDSTKQINNIIYESRELIRGKDLIVVFDIVKHIDRVIKILKQEISEANIKILFDNEQSFKIKGIVGLFERIIINLLVNAIEELKHKEGERTITINFKLLNQYILVEITDSGRGIAKENIHKIFKEDFSLKNTNYNLGLGLPFIKSTITQKFKGSIEVQSEISSYTKFTLSFVLLKEPIKIDTPDLI